MVFSLARVAGFGVGQTARLMSAVCDGLYMRLAGLGENGDDVISLSPICSE
jgi:hypothetical protein